MRSRERFQFEVHLQFILCRICTQCSHDDKSNLGSNEFYHLWLKLLGRLIAEKLIGLLNKGDREIRPCLVAAT